MKKILKFQKIVKNDVGLTENLDLLVAMDNVQLLQYTCPASDFYSVSHKDIIIYEENGLFKISTKPQKDNVCAIVTWYKYNDTNIIKLFLNEKYAHNTSLYNFALIPAFEDIHLKGFGNQAIELLIS